MSNNEIISVAVLVLVLLVFAVIS